MYESKTIDNILIEMLSGISDTYEKSIGYPTFDLTKSFAIETANLYITLDNIIKLLDVDNMAGDILTKYVLQRKGIERKTATFAKGTVTVTGNGAISINDLFSTATGIQFKSLEAKTITGSADVKVQAVLSGNVGNVGANTIVQFPITIQGITGVNNTLATYDGYEEERDLELRQRYYDALRLPATSGNIAHYKIWGKAVAGVGDVKVIPLWNGDNTVKVLVIDTDKKPANVELVNRVQDYIDPKGTLQDGKWTTWGTGTGEAPIGCYCTVVSATAKPINIVVDIQELPNYKLTDVTETIKTNITNYLKEIAFQQDFVSYAKIGSIILSTEGVQDYQTLTVNGGNSNVIVGKEEVAVLGTVTTT